MNFLIAVFAGVVICVLLFRKHFRDSESSIRDPPGPPRLPLVGNLFTLITRTCRKEPPIVTFAQWALDYGPIYSLKFANQKVVVVSNARLAQQLCNTHGDKVTERPAGLLLARILKNKGIVFNDGPSWKEHRTFLLHEFRKFGFGRQSVENRIQDVGAQLVRQLEKNKGKTYNPHLVIATATYNIIWAVVGGETFRWDDPFLRSLMSNLETNLKVVELVGAQNYVTLFTILHLIWNNPAHLLYIVSKRFYYFWTLIRRCKTNKDSYQECLISDYLQQIQGDRKTETTQFSAFQLLFFVSDLFIAGGETTITTLRWTVLLLAAYPECQEKIREQILSSFGSDTVISYADRGKIPLLEAFLHEVLRFSGVVPVMWRNVSADCHFQEYVIPKGTWILLHYWAMGHDPTAWNDPKSFLPGRFLESDGSFKKNDNLLAFSTGKRQCPGESLARYELFLLTATVLQKFRVRLPSNCTPDLEAHFGVTCCPPEYQVIFDQL